MLRIKLFPDDLECRACGHWGHRIYFSEYFMKRFDSVMLCESCVIMVRTLHQAWSITWNHDEIAETVKFLSEDWDGTAIDVDSYLASDYIMSRVQNLDPDAYPRGWIVSYPRDYDEEINWDLGLDDDDGILDIEDRID